MSTLAINRKYVDGRSGWVDADEAYLDANGDPVVIVKGRRITGLPSTSHLRAALRSDAELADQKPAPRRAAREPRPGVIPRHSGALQATF